MPITARKRVVHFFTKIRALSHLCLTGFTQFTNKTKSYALQFNLRAEGVELVTHMKKKKKFVILNDTFTYGS